MPMTWRACEMPPDATGNPVLRLHGALAKHVAAQRLSSLVSVTDESVMAAATVILQRDD